MPRDLAHLGSFAAQEHLRQIGFERTHLQFLQEARAVDALRREMRRAQETKQLFADQLQAGLRAQEWGQQVLRDASTRAGAAREFGAMEVQRRFLAQQAEWGRSMELARVAAEETSRIAMQPWIDLTREFQRQQNLRDSFASSLSRTIDRAYADAAVGALVAAAVSTALIEPSVEATDTESTEEVVFRAVTQALAQADSKVDTRFLVGLVFAVLLFLAQFALDQVESNAHDRSIEASEQAVLDKVRGLELAFSREVARKASLRMRPQSSSRLVALLPPGAHVVVREVKGPWVKVQVTYLQNGPGDGSPAVGWMLKKYLRAAF